MNKKLDPRQIKFLELYLNPQSDTFANALQSALKAGYRQEYAENIMSLLPKWLSESIEDTELVKKALKNLKDFLDEKKDKRIKADITKFVLERLYKRKFSTKTEVEHSGKVETLQKVDKETEKLLNEFHLWLKKKK